MNSKIYHYYSTSRFSFRPCIVYNLQIILFADDNMTFLPFYKDLVISKDILNLLYDLKQGLQHYIFGILC
jgi:hypothetical protein